MDTLLARVATLNIWNLSGPWRERRTEIVAWLDLLDADIVCLQEVMEAPDQRNQAAWLAERTRTSYHLAYGGAAIGDLRFGNAVLSRWPIEGSDVRDLPPSPLPGDVDRVLLHARTHGLDVFCTHLSWRPDDAATREAQVLAVVAEIEALADPQAPPPILAGDMNADPESNEIRFLSGQASLGGRSAYFQDAWAVAGGGGRGWTWDNRNPFAVISREPDRRIDYILAGWRLGGGTWVRRAELIGNRALTGVHPTDHYGLLAEIVQGPRDVES